MDIPYFGRPVTFDKLKPGACFALKLDDQTRIALKAIDADPNVPRQASAVIWPGIAKGHPPGFYNTEGHREVYELIGAALVPSFDPARIQVASGFDLTAGEVVIGEDTVCIGVANQHGDVVLVNVKTGVISGIPKGAVTRVSTWRIVREMFGEAVEICCYPV